MSNAAFPATLNIHHHPGGSKAPPTTLSAPPITLSAPPITLSAPPTTLSALPTTLSAPPTTVLAPALCHIKETTELKRFPLLLPGVNR
ncbi:hypothetical protein NHX12_004718 [Muraenolepis orangiensis]|uniref:Uncharacterized protein n=1 Tax=Muraenolepis orangiensis TaxID=630683 RepID=A0A9Q0DTA1_9TELE|nr:hypothetical protein NHX12_004718 [Muraenolepis orangiensis]